MDLNDPDCRFIVGYNADGDRLYCSDDKAPRYPYCPAHVHYTTGAPAAPPPPPRPSETPRQPRDYMDHGLPGSWRFERTEYERDLVELLAVAS